MKIMQSNFVIDEPIARLLQNRWVQTMDFE